MAPESEDIKVVHQGISANEQRLVHQDMSRVTIFREYPLTWLLQGFPISTCPASVVNRLD
jgi:hypothetical protein